MDAVRCGVRGVFIAIGDTAQVPVVVLESEEGLQLHIYIGIWEAIAINSARKKEVSPRPLTHDLIVEIMNRVPARFCRLRIDSVDDGVYYATLGIEKDGHEEVIDCRPSDGIVLALKSDAPICVAPSMLETGGATGAGLSNLIDLNEFMRL